MNELHRTAIVADAHNDLLMLVARRPKASWGSYFREHWIPQLRDGGIDVQVLPVFIDDEFRPEGALRETLRTGAVVGVATDLLAAADATRLTVIGTGAQSVDQVRAVLAVRRIAEVTLVGRDAQKASSLAAALGEEFPEVKFGSGTDIDAGVAHAEVICCATSSSTPLFRADALPERVHVNAIGAFRPTMRELPGDLLATASLVVVDQEEAALEESGEVIDAVESGALPRSSLIALGDALADPPTPSGRTVFKSVGVGPQDWAIAKLLAES